MSKRRVGFLALAAGAAISLLAGTIVARAQAQGTAALVKTASARMLTNSQGMTLYLFTPDKHNKSVCSGQCAAFWPPLLLPKGMKTTPMVSGVSGTLGVAMRADGTRQLTFDGAPLYTFVKDKKSGDMTGQGVEGVWWVVVASGDDRSSHDSSEKHGGSGSGSAATPAPTAKSYYSSGHGGDGDG